MSRTPGRLWDKGKGLDDLVHRFTVGDDPAWDSHLVHWDCLGSAAHARTLARIGLLSPSELADLLGGLAEIDALDRAGRFELKTELEDCHTAIEAYLVQHCGTAGEKIHAGRSRNDQVATAIRLCLRHHALGWLDALARFIDIVIARAQRDGAIPMPGYTHLRPAMPSSVGQWLHSFADAALEQMSAAIDLLGRLDSCPLGTGAGYGVPLPLDRAYTASLLGFSRVQRSPIDVQNSRGRMEKYFVRVGSDIAGLVEKLACDLLLFTTLEFGFFDLPEALTTGSSIMPQKHNPDVLELLRARSGRLRTRVLELEGLCAKLSSGYHRDLQLTKEPALRTAMEVPELLAVAGRVIEGLLLRPDRLSAAMRPELYAAHAALELAQTGVPFREAYRPVAVRLRAGGFTQAELDRGQSAESAADAWIDPVREELQQWVAKADLIRARVQPAEAALLPPPPQELDK